jgi:hypothetical protein
LIGHRLFTAFSDRPIEQIGHLDVDSAASHVAVLGHGDLRVAEVVGTDAG